MLGLNKSPTENFACRATHVLWIICDVDFNDGIQFWLRPKEKSRSGQIRSNFKIQNFLIMHVWILEYSLRIPKMLFIFTYVKQKCQKLRFDKVMSSQFTFTWFFTTAQPKIKLLLWNLACNEICLYKTS